jgi:Bacterial pre-peptidase C-terminal domain
MRMGNQHHTHGQSIIESLESRKLLSVSLLGATNLGTLNGHSTASSALSSTKTSVVWQLAMATAGSLKITLGGLTANADLQLIHDANGNHIVDPGETLATSAHTGTTSESITKTLAAGTYYVRAYESGTASTKLSLTLESDYAGNTLGAARNVGALTTSNTFKDFVGADDTNDFYKFTLASTKPFTATLNGLSADANMQLIQSSGSVLVTSAHTGTTAESISRALAAGTYYVRVYPGSGGTNYSLNLTPIGHLNVVFNYSYDSSGYFKAHPSAEARLNDAAATFEILTDSLAAIKPSSPNSWDEIFPNPGAAGGPQVTLANQTVAANTVVIYIGARSDLNGPELGQGGPGGWDAGGTQAWLNTVAARGQSGALASTPTDFGPWGGAITFSSIATWNFNSTAPQSGQNDFYSVALHEMGHVFGVGTADSWMDQSSGGKFNGKHAIAANGGKAPSVDSSDAHFAQGTRSTVNGVAQDVVMEPALLTGTRRQFTVLDYAALADIGWQVPTSGYSATAASLIATAAPASAFADFTSNDWLRKHASVVDDVVN